jgi:hypothetical protein
MTRAKLGKPNVEPSLPLGPRTARNRFGDDWTVRVTCGEGADQAQRKGDPRGDGSCPTWMEDVPCVSVALRAHHPDGRQVRAMWSQRLDPAPTGKPRPWSFAEAWRGRHDGETGPVQLNAEQLAAYTAQPEAQVLDLFTDPERIAA